ncbi:MAG TPA: hypothetical protein VNY05_39825 [Candidatus Acidoferrales bacterium]|nr:hypothetical protein [Candidatus Acidoferrales bacterium]
MANKTPEERLDRIERVVQVIAEDQVSLQKLIAEFATETAAALTAWRPSLRKTTAGSVKRVRPSSPKSHIR